VSWRLLAGGLSPWLSHRSYSTTSEEPPLSNFNNYRGIPLHPGPRWLAGKSTANLNTPAFYYQPARG